MFTFFVHVCFSASSIWKEPKTATLVLTLNTGKKQPLLFPRLCQFQWFSKVSLKIKASNCNKLALTFVLFKTLEYLMMLNLLTCCKIIINVDISFFLLLTITLFKSTLLTNKKGSGPNVIVSSTNCHWHCMGPSHGTCLRPLPLIILKTGVWSLTTDRPLTGIGLSYCLYCLWPPLGVRYIFFWRKVDLKAILPHNGISSRTVQQKTFEECTTDCKKPLTKTALKAVYVRFCEASKKSCHLKIWLFLLKCLLCQGG